jgi:hypothetical protein
MVYKIWRTTAYSRIRKKFGQYYADNQYVIFNEQLIVPIN